MNGAILHALNFKARTHGDLEELFRLQPIHHLITLGEPVFQVLRERFKLELPNKIKAVLETVDREMKVIELFGKKVTLLPLPHIFNKNNPRWDFYRRFIEERLPNLTTIYIQEK